MYESQRDPSQRPESRHESNDRDHSMSVSPKTRVGSLSSNQDKVAASRHSSDARPSAPPVDAPPVQAPPAQALAEAERARVERAVTPAKRKLDDRSMSPRELDQQQPRPPPGETNGRNATMPEKSSASPAAAAAAIPARKKRSHRPQPPVWAQTLRSLGNKLPTHANFVLQKRTDAHTNGKRESTGQADTLRRESTEPAAVQQPAQPSQAANPAAAPAPPVEPGPQDILGPWEASILGVKPYEEVSKAIADFLFINVVNSSDIQEVLSRGIEFEIEAKLGTLIDKDTNHRIDRMLDSECILQDTGRVAFKSSMTEVRNTKIICFCKKLLTLI